MPSSGIGAMVLTANNKMSQRSFAVLRYAPTKSLFLAHSLCDKFPLLLKKETRASTPLA